MKKSTYDTSVNGPNGLRSTEKLDTFGSDRTEPRSQPAPTSEQRLNKLTKDEIAETPDNGCRGPRRTAQCEERPMNIELRNVKYAAFASEETACFSAAVFIDGKRVGEVSNDGHGGCHRYSSFELEDRLDAHAKTLPPIKKDWCPEGLQQTADILIDRALDYALMARDLKRCLKDRLVFVRDGKVFRSKRLPPDALAQALANPARALAQFKATALLNALPFDEALALFIAGIAS
jgi:hypothetical protein